MRGFGLFLVVALATVGACQAWERAWDGPATNPKLSPGECRRDEHKCPDEKNPDGTKTVGGCCPEDSRCAYGGKCVFLGLTGVGADAGDGGK